MSKRIDIDTPALRALVGEAQVDARAAIELLDETGARAEDCETSQGRALWAAVESMLRAGEPLDVVTLAARVQAPRDWLVSVLTSPEHGVARQRLVLLRESSLRRQYLEALRCVARVVTDRAQPLSGAVAEAGKLLASWTDETAPLRSLDTSMAALVDELEAVAEGRRVGVVPTGLEALDAVIGGMQPTLTMVGALPGVGKSALVAGVAYQLARRGDTVGVLSLEDERGWLPRRLLALESSVPGFVLAFRRLADSQRERVASVWGRLQANLARVLCDDRPGLTTADVVASCRRMIARGAKAILVDHLGEIALSRSERHDLDIADCLRELRTVAKTTRVPVWVFAHLRRREGLGRFDEPRLTDFAFSAGIERMARVALGLYRAEGDGGALKVAVLKQTNGVSDVSLSLNLDVPSGVVIETAATAEQRALYGEAS